MGKSANKTGKKGGKKIGRQSRKPSHSRYVNEGRWEKNKARKAEKIKKDLDKKAARKAKKD